MVRLRKTLANLIVPALIGHLFAFPHAFADPGNSTYFRLVPVDGPVPYPLGTMIDAEDGTITIAYPDNALVYLDVRLGGYGTPSITLTSYAWTIDAATYGSGEGKAIVDAVRPCDSDADCAVMFGAATTTPYCNANVCLNALIDTTREDFLPDPLVFACSSQYLGRACGATPNEPLGQNVGELYGGTVVLDVPPGARGEYTIGFIMLATFIDDPSGFPYVPDVTPARIIVPIGSCCHGVGSAGSGCAEGVTQGECDALPSPRYFRPDATCDVPCGDCSRPNESESLCEDSDPCTYDLCGAEYLCIHSSHPFPSDSPPTACCLHGGEQCQDLDPECCAVRGGQLAGYGANCAASFCPPPIPAVSEWGMAVLVLTILTVAKLAFGRATRRPIG